jgi:type IV secretion system protein VirD4
VGNVHFILDEAASLGANMSCIDDAIDKYRGYGVRLQLYLQSMGQLKAMFPKDAGQTCLANMAAQIFMGVSDPETAKFCSERLGEETVIVESGGTGSGSSSQSGHMGHSHYGRSSNASDNWSQVGRPLLRAEEIMRLDERIALTFIQGLPGICTRLERYFEKGSIRPRRFQRLTTFIWTALIFATATFFAAGMTAWIKEYLP